MKIKRDFKVKVTALKTDALCEQCQLDKFCENAVNCLACEVYDRLNNSCKCSTIEEKQPCPYYVKANKQEA